MINQATHISNATVKQVDAARLSLIEPEEGISLEAYLLLSSVPIFWESS
jgi:hypothetical protein